MTFRLEIEGGDTLELNAANGYTVREFNPGFPTVRAVVDDRPSGDGVDDRTAFFGSRLVSLDIVARGERQTITDELAPFLLPSARPYLYYPIAGGGERRILLRPRDRQQPWRGTPLKSEMLLQWEAPNGTTERSLENEVEIAAVVPAEPGFLFDITFDLVFPESSPTGSTTITTNGTARCYPVFQLWGPCTNPRIENFSDGGKTLDFNITLGTGEYLEVDVRERTVYLDGLSNKNRYYTLDFATSEWWTLVPGDNLVRYYPVSFASPSHAVITYRCQFL